MTISQKQITNNTNINTPPPWHDAAKPSESSGSDCHLDADAQEDDKTK
jgi:hypothetical protein